MKLFIIDSKNNYNAKVIYIIEQDTFAGFKYQIKNKNKISDNIELLFNGIILDDNGSLFSYGISEDF